MVEADERPPARPPLLPAMSSLDGPKSRSLAARAASGVKAAEKKREAATMDDPMVLVTSSDDIRSSVECFTWLDAGAKADADWDIANTVARIENLTIFDAQEVEDLFK